jgi:hypothetical protein
MESEFDDVVHRVYAAGAAGSPLEDCLAGVRRDYGGVRIYVSRPVVTKAEQLFTAITAGTSLADALRATGASRQTVWRVMHRLRLSGR